MAALRSVPDPSAVADVIAQLENVKSTAGGGFTARCPAHDDDHNSLSIDIGSDGRVLLHCFAGCACEQIVAALDLTAADLFVRHRRAPVIAVNGREKRISATYDYHDEGGLLRYQVLRDEPKGFRQRQPDGHGGWDWNLNGVERVLYRLPELLAASVDEPVFLCEGEKDTDRLRSLGVVATTNAGGASASWPTRYSETLRSRRVVILPDNDEAGGAHAAKVALALHGVAASVRILTLPGLPEKGDVSDWLDGGGTVDELRARAKAAPTWEPEGAAGERRSDLVVGLAPGLRDGDLRPRFHLLTTAEARHRSPPAFLIDGVLVRNTVAALTGAPDTFKTFTALDMGLAIGAGRDWQGLRTRPGGVVYVSAEGGAGIGRRIGAWEEFHGTTSTGFRLLPEAVQFLDDTEVDALVEVIDALPEPPVLIVIDTLARCLVGGDENSQKDMGLLVAGAARLQRATGACMLFLHHHTWEGRIRGSTSLLGALDCHLIAERAGDLVVLTSKKAKDWDPFPTIRLKPRAIDLGTDDEGAAATSLVLVQPDAPQPLGGTAHRVLELLARLEPAGATAKAWEDACKEAGIPRSTFSNARKDLSERRLVTHSTSQKGELRRPTAAGLALLKVQDSPWTMPLEEGAEAVAAVDGPTTVQREAETENAPTMGKLDLKSNGAITVQTSTLDLVQEGPTVHLPFKGGGTVDLGPTEEAQTFAENGHDLGVGASIGDEWEDLVL